MFFNFPTPCTLIVAGPSGAGKSTFLKKLIDSRATLFARPFKKIHYYYAESAACPRDIAGIEYFQGMPETIHNSPENPMLMILDDLMSDAYNAQISQLFTRGSHHMNITVVLVTQNVFKKSPHARGVSLNAHFIVYFKNPRDKAQISHLARQIYPENSREMVRMFNEVTREPHTYLIIDLTQRINEKLRFRTDIFNDDYESVCYTNIDDFDPDQLTTIDEEPAYEIST